MEYFWLYIAILLCVIMLIIHQRKEKHYVHKVVNRPNWNWWGWRNRGMNAPLVGAMRSTYVQPHKIH